MLFEYIPQIKSWQSELRRITDKFVVLAPAFRHQLLHSLIARSNWVHPYCIFGGTTKNLRVNFRKYALGSRVSLPG